MATIYKPNHSIDVINSNFAANGSNMDQFISDNFSTGSTSGYIQVVSPTTSPINIDLASRIAVDYGDGPVSVGLKQYLFQINLKVQNGSESIFYDGLISGRNVDFATSTLETCKAIVNGNLSMQPLILNTIPELQEQYDIIVNSIVISLRKGEYDYAMYTQTLTPICRKIAKGIVKKYG